MLFHRKNVLKYLCLFWALLYMSCSIGDVAGTGSSTGNAKVVGKVLDKYCNPAQNAFVYLVPVSYNPVVEESFPDSLIDTTDEDGNYDFPISGSGKTYNLFAVHGENRTQLFHGGITTTGDIVAVPAKKLHTPGIIKAILPDSIDTTDGYVYIPGTREHIGTAGNVIFNAGNYILYIDDIPPATFNSLYYARHSDPFDTFQVADSSYTVPINDTVTVGSYKLGLVYNCYNSGLPNNGIWSVAIDKDGSKWFGTYSGEVAHFNGTEWVIYDLTYIGVREILCIAVDNYGTKWFGAHDALVKFDGAYWQVYDRVNSDFPGGSIYTIAVDRDNVLWMTTYRVGVVKFDGMNWTIYDFFNSGIPSSYVYDIAIDNDNNKWIATQFGVAKFDDITWTKYNSFNSPIPCDTVFSIGIDLEGNKWFGTFRGEVVKFDDTNWEIYNRWNSTLPGYPVHTIVVDQENAAWFGTEQGHLVKYDNGEWLVYCSSNSNIPPFADHLYKIAVDNLNNKWVTMNGGGVIVFGSGLELKK